MLIQNRLGINISRPFPDKEILDIADYPNYLEQDAIYFKLIAFLFK